MRLMLTCEPLRLLAFDKEDLAVISTHLQDAEVKPSDVAYLPREKRFALVLDRFDWCSAQSGTLKRRRTGLHFERVLHVRRARFEPAGDKPCALLSVSFEPSDAPAGNVTLLFADGAAIRLEVECLEAAMKDLGPEWTAEAAPVHQAMTS
jgi:hypothetical protein